MVPGLDGQPTAHLREILWLYQSGELKLTLAPEIATPEALEWVNECELRLMTEIARELLRRYPPNQSRVNQ